MKTLSILAWCLAGAGSLLAQDVPEEQRPPGVVMLKLEWSKEVFSPSPYEGLPGAAPSRSVPGVPTVIRPVPRTPAEAKPYNYSMKLKNDGAKAIKAVAWEYIFTDPSSKKEVGRHLFNSYQKVSPKKSGTFLAQSPSPPSHLVSAEGLGKDKRSPFLERAIIKCVLYRDGTQWAHPAAQGSECEDLRNEEKITKRSKTR